MSEIAKLRIFIIGVLLFLALALFLYFARAVLTPFILAFLITYLLSPLVVKIQSFGYRRWVAVVLIAFFLCAVLVIAVFGIAPALIKEFENLNVDFLTYYNYIYDKFEFIKDKIETAFPIASQYHISDIAAEKIKDFIISTSQKIPSYLTGIISAFSNVVLVPMLVFFMLIGKRRPVDIIVEMIPSYSVETILSIIYEINSVLGKYIRGQLIEAAFVGTMGVLVLSFLDINFALLIGITAGFANFIPYVGPAVGLILASITGLVQYQDIVILFKIIPAFLIIQFLDNNIVQPLAIGHNVNLSPVTMVFAMLAAAQVFGFFGILFAVPTAAILKTIFATLLQKYKKAV